VDFAIIAVGYMLYRRERPQKRKTSMTSQAEALEEEVTAC